MFPFYSQPPTSRLKDLLEDLKAFEDWQKANKPKDDKKDKNPNDWGPFDYFLMYLVLHTTAAWIMVLTIEQYIKH